MSRTFYTERDIEDMAKRGVTEIEINDSVYITDVAREMMDKLGIKRKVTNGAPASSSVLKSPDVANLHVPTLAAATVPSSVSVDGGLDAAEKQEVIAKVKSGVIARLGPSVDVNVVEQIVRRVVGKL